MQLRRLIVEPRGAGGMQTRGFRLDGECAPCLRGLHKEWVTDALLPLSPERRTASLGVLT